MKRKSNVFSQAIVGFFMVSLMVMLGYFTICVSGVNVFSNQDRKEVRIVFDQVGGLKDHDNVMYRGTKVGTVHHVEVTASNLVVHAMVDRNVILRETCSAGVYNLSMLGGTYLQLEEGTGSMIDSAAFVVKGENPSDWMRDMAKIAKNLSEFTSREELTSIMTNINAVSIKANVFMDKAENIADRFESGANEVNGLIKDVRQVIDNYRDTTPITTFSSLATGAL